MRRMTDACVPLALAFALGSGLLHAQAPVAPPVLAEPGSLEGLNLDFSRGARLAEVFQALAKPAGVAILLHASVPADLSTSADLRGMGFQRVLDSLMLQNDLFYQVLDPHSLMVFRKTPQNLQDHEAKFLQTFHLANAEVDAVRQTMNALMPQMRVFVDKRLNTVTLSCSANELPKVQQLIKGMDVARGELRIQMEIVEVTRKASAAAGLLPRIGASPTADTKPVALDQALAKLLQDRDSRVLASPDLRVVSGESSEVRIGRRLGADAKAGVAKAGKDAAAGKPEGAGPAAAGEDLGLRIKLRPRLRTEQEISLELEYELTDPLPAGDAGRPRSSERTLKTSVRLKEGETAVFGGLLEDEANAGGRKEKKDRVLVLKALVLRPGGQ